MDSEVVVTADPAGTVVSKSSNPIYGYMRVEQARMMQDDTGFVRRVTLSALVVGSLKDLKAFGWEEGQVVSGKIIVKESLEPFNKKNPDKDFKMAGSSGVVCCVGDSPIYRKHFYVMSSKAEDGPVIEHTNGEEIKAVYSLAKESSSGEFSSEDFNL